jgi:hypothetical protein
MDGFHHRVNRQQQPLRLGYAIRSRGWINKSGIITDADNYTALPLPFGILPRARPMMNTRKLIQSVVSFIPAG